ncbi:MAG: NAD(P)H-dependent oxidoreductase [Polyangiaceae bacterium]|nr:NAD(P)H-dependent oxidoreductase [Polyangiaceae bacterium]
MKRLLIIYHSQTGRTARMAQACQRGAVLEVNVETRLVCAKEAVLEDLQSADALLFGTPENFGYMSGALKDFFDRTYRQAQGKLRPLPYAIFISCETDGTGAVRNIERICRGYGFRAVAEPIIARKEVVTAEDELRCEELGQTLAAGLDLGIF